MQVALFIFLIRGSVLASRLGVTVFITYYLGIEAVGQFGIINGLLSIVPVISGLGLHYHLNRQLVHLPLSVSLHRIRDRIIATACAVIVVLFFGSGIYIQFFGVSIQYVLLIITLIFIETIAFDIHLSLISLRHPGFANLFIFLRSSAWILPFVLFAIFVEDFRKIEVVLIFWITGGIVAFLSLFIYARAWPIVIALRARVDLDWIKANIASSWLVFLSDISMVGAIYIDRFVISYQFGLKQVGIFVFFWSLSNGLQLLINTSLIQPLLPILVDTYKNDHQRKFLAAVKKGALTVSLAAAAMISITYPATLLLIPYMNKLELAGYPPLFPCLLAAAAMKALSDLINYTLYAQAKDTALAYINILSVLTMSGFVLGGGHLGGLVGVGYGVLANNVLILILRFQSAKLWRIS